MSDVTGVTIVGDDLESSISPGENSDDDEQLARRRIEKIHQHLDETLESADTLQACLGPVCCDLFEMARELKAALDEALASAGSAREKLEKMTPAIRLYLKVVQQAERLAKLDVRISETKRLNEQLTQQPK